MRSIRNLIVMIFLVITFVVGCKDKSGEDFSSTRSQFTELVTSHTAGFVSSESEIKIVLTTVGEGAEAGKEIDQKLFQFEPSIAGKAFWENERTIVFKPADKLVSGQNYKARFMLAKVIETDSDKREYKFTFQCIPQNYEVKIEGMTLYDAANLTRVKIQGTLQTSDVASSEEVERIISASQNGNPLDISYEHSIGNNQHRFTIEEIVRSEEAGKVQISWEGKPIAVDKAGKTEYTIPSLSDYSITSVNLVRGGSLYISVLFSDPIDESQNLRGVVQLSEGLNPRVVADLNELRIYPSSQITGRTVLQISKIIKNVAGYSLKEDYSTSVVFSTLKPQIRLAANSGTIMPNSEGLIVPFEAVSLSAVDVTIVEIFESNIMQYLQRNDFGDGSMWDLEPVGRPVARKTIPLGATGAVDLGSWNRYVLDVSNYVEISPGAFYQVRINFRKSYSLYACEGQETEISFDEDLEFEQTLDWANKYDNYYYYDWENRENPCHQAYYTSQNIITKTLFSSNIGIIAKGSENADLHVFTSDLLSTDPIAGAGIKVYDYQQQLIGQGKTDGQGKVTIAPTGKPFVVTALSNGQIGYLKVDNGSALSVSNFNVSGSYIQNGIKGFLYGERGVWRPADTLHLAFMLEDIYSKLPDDHPVILEVFNPTGQLYTRMVQNSSVNDLFTFKVVTSKDDPTGNWFATAKVGGTSFSKQLKIEAVKPNRLKMDLEIDGEKLYGRDPQHQASLSVRWLHGAVARNLRASYEMVLSPTKTAFDGYEQYIFDDPDKSFETEVESVFDGRVNSEGQASFNFEINTGSRAPGMLNAAFRGKAFEEGGNFSIDNTIIPYAPYSHFVGLNVPSKDRYGRLMADTDHNLNIVTLDDRGRPTDRDVVVELYKISWRWWWDNSWESSSSYTNRNYSEKISTGSVHTTNGKGSYRLRIARDWGRYYLRVIDPASGHSTGKVFYLTYPGWARQVRGQLGGVSMLDFTVEQEEVNVGDPINISFPSSEGGRALISLETGSEVIQTQWVNSTGQSTSVMITATEEMVPNVYANITLLQPHAQTANDLPIRMYGIQPIKVVDNRTVLNPEIQMPDELKPGQKFKVRVSESNGRPMSYTLAIVEDGLLDLTNFKTPDPWKSFYAHEALGVKTWDVYEDVIGSYGGTIEELLAIGGDGEIEGPKEREANRFKPVVMYKGPLFLNSGDEAVHEFTMPEYVGSVRVMLVAGYEGKYGHSEKQVPVKQPLMILATLPRVAGPGEVFSLPVNVFALDNNIRDVKIDVAASGQLSMQDKSSQTVTFRESGDQVSYFQLKAKEDLGVGKVSVTATAGEVIASYNVELQVRPSNPPITQVEESLLAGGQSWNFKYRPLGIASTNEAALEVSSLPPLNLEQRLKFLIRYPHGCIEQTTSSVFAQLYLDDLVELSDERLGEIQNNINAAIDRLKKFQLTSGAFAYWPGSSEPSYWGTNYAGHFLVEAKKRGYLVPDDMLRRWTNFQQNEANQWNASRYNDYLVQSYRLYVLAISGNPSLGAMNRMKENAAISNQSKWMLASSYAAAGYQGAASEIVSGLTTQVSDYRELGGTYGSTQRDQAMIIETLVRMDRQTDAFALLRILSDYMSDQNRWMSTQTTAYCFIATAEYAKKYATGENIDLQVTIGGNDFRVDGTKYLSQVTIIEPDKAADITVNNKGANSLFVRVVREGVPLEGLESASESNIKLTVSYKDTDGFPIKVDDLAQGTDFVAEVTVRNPGLRSDYEEIAITQIFPSGWEILNTRLDDSEAAYQQSVPEYQDIRDDRVMTYFDLRRNQQKTFKIMLNASYQGRFYLPAVQVEAMYDNSIAANTEGKWVTVSAED